MQLLLQLPRILIFSSTIVASTIIVLSASHWLVIWMALELNLLSFIPLISVNNTQEETEAALNYFLAQAVGSAIILLSIISFYFISFHNWEALPPIILTLGLLLNLGAAPFHYWLPNVIAGLSWTPCFILMTWQNIAPLSILFTVLSCSICDWVIPALTALGALIGGLGGIRQAFIRPLLAYSSIGHLSWILALSTVSSSLAFAYLAVYALLLAPLLLTLSYLQLYSLRQLLSPSPIPPLPSLVLIVSLMSLGGLPPLLGFLPNWVALEILASSPFPSYALLVLILGSLINLYYYLNVCFSLILSINSTLTPVIPFKVPISPMAFLIPSAMLLPIAVALVSLLYCRLSITPSTSAFQVESLSQSR